MNTKNTLIARLLCAALLALPCVPGYADEPRPYAGTMGTRVIASTSGAAPDRVREYYYDAGGNVIRIAEDTFVYDTVDRVVSGSVSGRERRYTYDAFGNRLTCTDAASGADCQYGAAIASATNRIAAAQYDGPGSVEEYAGQTYRYDAAGMLQSRNNGETEYVYTADDERIAVISGGGWNWTLRDLSHKVLREASSTPNMDGTHGDWRWSRDNVFRDGTLLSSVDPAATRHYHTDHLGTPRVVSDTTGQIVGVHDYFAFGLEVSGNPSEASPGRLRFTGHERDNDGLDYMHARYYDARWGRFLSVDPGKDWDPEKPQSWNMYAYLKNAPMKSIDPDGRKGKEVIRPMDLFDRIRNPGTLSDLVILDVSLGETAWSGGGTQLTAEYRTSLVRPTEEASVKVAVPGIGGAWVTTEGQGARAGTGDTAKVGVPEPNPPEGEGVIIKNNGVQINKESTTARVSRGFISVTVGFYNSIFSEIGATIAAVLETKKKGVTVVPEIGPPKLIPSDDKK